MTYVFKNKIVDKDQLIDIFNSTKDNALRDEIALIFADMDDPSVVPVLVEKIRELKYSRHISTLIYACSEYDCGEWVEFFAELVVDLDDAARSEAINVLEEIRLPVRLGDKVIAIKRLSDRLLALAGDEYKAVAYALEVVDGLETLV